MNLVRPQLDAPTKIVGFVVGVVLLFLAAFLVGGAIGPDTTGTESTGHDMHDASSSLSVVPMAEFTIEVQKGQA